MKVRRRTTVVAALAAAAALTALVAASGPASARVGSPTKPTATTLRIWTDSDRRAAITKVANAWARSRGVSVQIVVKQFTAMRDELKTVKSNEAPDVGVVAGDWMGDLSTSGLIVPIIPKKSALAAVPKYARQGLSYGGRLYGMPTTVENIGLVVNTKLAQVPKNWADLERRALAFKKRGSGRAALDVQQGGGDPYHMYPLFSGLCGYIFGHTKSGALNPKNLGVANKTFLKNSTLIDKWNKEGLVDAKIDANTSTQLFTSKKAAYWITGPWNIDTIKKAGITSFKVVQVPRIKCRAVPFLGVNGLSVTRFAAQHGVASAAKDFVASYMAKPSAQLTLATANNRAPANVQALKKVKDPYIRQFGKASGGGVPVPNIPQMNSVWSDLGTAWVKSTKGAGATKARAAFITAAKNIRAKINAG
jgi:arabinogalactan oligomer / maltooligosaccharide transport system substrate-binding protein